MIERLVSVILTTKNRPTFLALALRYYREQMYAYRELVVVDDGDVASSEPELVTPDVTYIRLNPGEPLGTKLNLGIQQCRGAYILKMDDDDYYARDFLAQMMRSAIDCNPETSVSFLQPFLFLDIRTMNVRQSDPGRCSGATLLFHRRYWERQAFRDLPAEVDAHFLLDHGFDVRDPQSLNRVGAIESFLQVRHGGHLWNRMPDGEHIDEYLAGLPLYHKTARELVPDWAYQRYLAMQRDLAAVISS